MIAKSNSNAGIRHVVVPCANDLDSRAAILFAMHMLAGGAGRLSMVEVRDHDADAFDGISALGRLHRVLEQPERYGTTPVFSPKSPAEIQPLVDSQHSHIRLLSRTGDLVAQVAEVCRADPADAVVLQTQRRPWYSWFRHSGIAEEIQAATHCPVVLVPKHWTRDRISTSHAAAAGQ